MNRPAQIGNGSAAIVGEKKVLSIGACFEDSLYVYLGFNETDSPNAVVFMA